MTHFSHISQISRSAITNAPDVSVARTVVRAQHIRPSSPPAPIRAAIGRPVFFVSTRCGSGGLKAAARPVQDNRFLSLTSTTRCRRWYRHTRNPKRISTAPTRQRHPRRRFRQRDPRQKRSAARSLRPAVRLIQSHRSQNASHFPSPRPTRPAPKFRPENDDRIFHKMADFR